MAYTDKTSQYHDRVRAALLTRKGQIMRTAELRAQLIEILPEIERDISWITLADHCNNSTPKGACRCAGTADALVESVGSKNYKVL